MYKQAQVTLTLTVSSFNALIFAEKEVAGFVKDLSESKIFEFDYSILAESIEDSSEEIVNAETLQPNETTVAAIERARNDDVKLDDIDTIKQFNKEFFVVVQKTNKGTKHVKDFQSARSAAKWIKTKAGKGTFGIRKPDGSYHRWDKESKWKKFS